MVRAQIYLQSGGIQRVKTKRQKIGTMSGAQALKDRAGAKLGAGAIRTPVWNNESVETELLH